MKRNDVSPLPWRRDNHHAIFLVGLGREQRHPSMKHSIKWTILGLCNKDSRLSSKISKHRVGKFSQGSPWAETESNGGVGCCSVRHWTWQKNFLECMQWVKAEAHSPKTQWFLCFLRGFLLDLEGFHSAVCFTNLTRSDLTALQILDYLCMNRNSIASKSKINNSPK